jgi:hypothetical protein
VFGTFFGIGEEFGFEGFVFGGRFAAWAGPGERSNGGLSLIDSNHDFRGTAGQMSVGGLQQEHEWAGIDHSEKRGRRRAVLRGTGRRVFG